MSGLFGWLWRLTANRSQVRVKNISYADCTHPARADLSENRAIHNAATATDQAIASRANNEGAGASGIAQATPDDDLRETDRERPLSPIMGRQ
jgi:hypothetical protein